MVWRQAITDKSLYSGCITDWSISAPLVRLLDWRGQHNAALRHWNQLSLALSRKITGLFGLSSSKMLLHVSNTNKPSMERWQVFGIRNGSSSKFNVLWHTIYRWLVSKSPFGERWREEAVKEVQKGELLILISFGTAVVIVSVDSNAEPLYSFFRLGYKLSLYQWWKTNVALEWSHIKACIQCVYWMWSWPPSEYGDLWWLHIFGFKGGKP